MSAAALRLVPPGEEGATMRGVAAKKKTSMNALAELRAWAETEAERRHLKAWGADSAEWKRTHGIPLVLKPGSPRVTTQWSDWVQSEIGVHQKDRRWHDLDERVCVAMQRIHDAIESARADREVWINVAEVAPAIRDVHFDPIGMRRAVTARPTATEILKRVQDVFAEWFGPLWKRRGGASHFDLTVLAILAGYTSDAIQSAPDLAAAIKAAMKTAGKSVERRRAARKRTAEGSDTRH